MTVQALRPLARPAASATASPGRQGFAGAGLALGSVAGMVLGFAMAGSRLGLPVLAALVGGLAGLCLGVLVAEGVARLPRRSTGDGAFEPAAAAAPAAPPAVVAAATVAPAPPAALLPAPPAAPASPVWLTDPEDVDRLRLWDGTSWTEHVWRRRR
jgi:Protein of unknown function (DUF2510)